MVFITVHFNILCLTCCYKECQNLETLSSIIFLPSFGLKVLFALHPQCLVTWKNPKDGPGTLHLTSVGPSVSALEAVGCSDLRMKLL